MLFLDNHSTTKVHPEVIESMSDYLRTSAGNPHSAHHLPGRLAASELEKSKETIGKFFGVYGENIILTAGATEANNLAIIGAARKNIENNPNKRIGFISCLEHKCVVEAAMFLKKEGFEIHRIPYEEKNGFDANILRDLISEETNFVSIMGANNETSDSLNINLASEICSQNNVYFHSDFTQAIWGNKIDIIESKIGALSISAHKINGPPGIGALICRERPEEFLSPIIFGGLQEENIRSGTSPVHLAIGFAKAIEILDKNFSKNTEKLHKLLKTFSETLLHLSSQVEINSKNTSGRPGGGNFHIKGLAADDLCAYLGKKIAISGGAACSGVGLELSETLTAMGFNRTRVSNSIRICFSTDNNENDAIFAAQTIADAIDKLR